MKLLFVAALLTAPAALAADAPKPKARPKPEFQYKTEGIAISIPTADEPKVTAFNAATIKAAAQYLNDGAVSWVREKSCINCHTTGPYMAERPALSALLGAPNEEIRGDFVISIPAVGNDSLKAKKRSGASTSVWCTLGLAEWDKHVTGKLSEETARSLNEMMTHQTDAGAFISTGEVEIPHITTDFELTLQAARAITAAPGWLAGQKDDAAMLARIDKMKTFLRESKPRNDYEGILRLQLAATFPGLLSQTDVAAALALLTQKQHTDGGWCLRDMSATDNWRTPMSEFVLKLIPSLPDAAQPLSDPYMTALAIVLMRQNNVPASDERIQRGLTWLKREQRVSGRWWMHSLYRGNYQYITYIATIQALKALALCGELDIAKAPTAAR